MNLDKLKKEFIEKINTYENFKEYDQVFSYSDENNLSNKSPKDFAREFIEEIFDELTYSVESLEDLKIYIDEDEFNGACLSKWIIDKSRSLVDIYYNDIYKSLPVFADWVNEAKKEFGMNEDISIEIQQGQNLCYQEIIIFIVDKLRDYINVLDLENEKNDK